MRQKKTSAASDISGNCCYRTLPSVQAQKRPEAESKSRGSRQIYTLWRCECPRHSEQTGEGYNQFAHSLTEYKRHFQSIGQTFPDFKMFHWKYRVLQNMHSYSDQASWVHLSTCSNSVSETHARIF